MLKNSPTHFLRLLIVSVPLRISLAAIQKDRNLSEQSL